MPSYAFDEVVVWDALPGGGLRTLRGGKVTVKNAATGAVLATLTATAQGRVSFTTTDVPTVILETTDGFQRRVTAAAAIEAAAGFTVSEDAAVAALVGSSGSSTRGALGALYPAKGDIAYAAADYGVTANGTTDDRTALLAALNASRVLVLPKGGTIRLASKLTIPAGRTIITNGCTFIVTGALNDYALQVGTGTTIVGGLTLTTPTGADVRGIEVVGDDITIDRLTVTAASSAAGAGDINDLGLSIRNSNRVEIGQANITNFDYAARVQDSADVAIPRLRITTYVRGLYISNVKGMTFGGRITGASPNAAVTPGHNGVLIDATSNGATTDILHQGVVVSDAGEHGFRIGGSFTVKRVAYAACWSTNVGGCGFKVLGDSTNKHEDLTFTDCVVEDAAQSGTNGAGFMLQYVRRAKVNGGIIRKNAKTFSASEGFNIQGASEVTVNDPDIMDTAERAYACLPNLGNQTNIRLNGGRIVITAGVGIRIDYTGFTFRRVGVEGWPQIEPSGTAIAVSILNTGGTGSIVGGVWVTWQSVAAGGLQVDTGAGSNVSAYFADVRAPYVATPPVFKNGSRWVDNSTGVLRTSNGTTYV